MTDSDQVVSGPVDQGSIDEAFHLLGDETRLSVMKALWEAHDPLKAEPVPFSDLREEVDADDPGRLNYHLNKLTDHFIRRTDDGYRFREAGKRVMRVVISGTALSEVSIEPSEIDVSCLFCDGPTELIYEDGQLAHKCLECASRCVAEYPSGLLSQEEVPPAGLLNRTIDDVYASNRVWLKHRQESVMDRVCPECSAPMPVVSIRICEDHDPDPTAEEVCESCGSIFWGVAHHVCDVCKFHMQLPTSLYPTTHPAVRAFYYQHGIEFDLASHEQRAHLLEYRQSAVSDDPLRIRTRIPLDGDEIAITFDDQMSPIEVNW